MPSLHVLDLSHHNDVKSWDDIAASGIVGVILKATEGSTYQDPKYQLRAREARNAGLKVASYHYLHAGNIAEQMKWFIETVQPDYGERMVIDHEADASLEELEQAVRTLYADPHDLQITVYSGHLIKEQLGADGYSETLAELTSLWIAQYTSGSPSWPEKTWPSISLWQWTDSATVQGAVGPVDGNQFNGSAENCALWIGPTPVPQPVESSIQMGMIVARGTKITLTINGEVQHYVAA